MPRAQEDRHALAEEIAKLRVALEKSEAELATERAAREALESSDARRRKRPHVVAERADRLAAELEAAAQANTEMNRRLQEIEARRALEVAEDEGRAHIDELLTATQERLAGQSEKLIAAEERLRELERQSRSMPSGSRSSRRSSDSIRWPTRCASCRARSTSSGGRRRPCPRRTSARRPFIKEMSMDAQKTISRMMGVAQLLKHKRDAKEQAQLVQQLTANGRRLDNTVRDLSDIDSLVTGTISLELRNTELESLIRRVAGGIRDRDRPRRARRRSSRSRSRSTARRTEQIIQALLRSAADRTPEGKTITVRLIPTRVAP